MARPKGFEPLTPRFVVWCSIQLSYGRKPRGAETRQGRGGRQALSPGRPMPRCRNRPPRAQVPEAPTKFAPNRGATCPCPHRARWLRLLAAPKPESSGRIGVEHVGCQGWPGGGVLRSAGAEIDQ